MLGCIDFSVRAVGLLWLEYCRFPASLKRFKPTVVCCIILNAKPQKKEKKLLEYDIQLTKFPRFLIKRKEENTQKFLRASENCERRLFY